MRTVAGSRLARLPSHPERRRRTRFPVRTSVCGYLRSAAGEAPAVKLVSDIATVGIGLVLDRPLEPGTIEALSLINVLNGFTCRVVLRIVHAAEQPDGTFAIGATFAAELDLADLWGLV
jgi:hypothetical protein